MSAEKDNPGVFVRMEDCRDRHRRIELALYGSEGTSGMVKDIHDIKSSLNATSTFVIKFVVPIVTAITSSVVTALILGYVFHFL